MSTSCPLSPSPAKKPLGFSLIEVIIAGGLMVGLAAAMLQIANLQQKVLATTEAGQDTADLVNQVRVALSTPEACKKSFGGSKVAEANVPKIYRAYQNPADKTWVYSDLLETGKKFGSNLSIKSIKFIGSTAVPFDGAGNAEVEIERTKQGVMGGVTVIRRVALFVKVDETDSTLIEECSADTLASGGSDNRAAVCEALGITYNATTGRCEGLGQSLVNTSSSANCKPGSAISLKVVDGKITTSCSSCDPFEMFVRVECRMVKKTMTGGMYGPFCWNRSVCANDHSIVLSDEYSTEGSYSSALLQKTYKDGKYGFGDKMCNNSAARTKCPNEP